VGIHGIGKSRRNEQITPVLFCKLERQSFLYCRGNGHHERVSLEDRVMFRVLPVDRPQTADGI
jgi:hypothetical protein